MTRRARSARGDIVDFDLIAIKEQLALKPVPVGVDQRRKFIDEKDGIKTKEVVAPVASALALAVEAAEVSAQVPAKVVEESKVAAPVAKPAEAPKAAAPVAPKPVVPAPAEAVAK
jgi:hypothetical protein